MSGKPPKALLDEIGKAHRELNSGRRVNAVLIYEKLAKETDLDAPVLFALANLSMALEGAFQAIGHIEAALEQDPGNPQYLGVLGAALHAERRIEEATDAYERALAGDPDQLQVLNGLGVIHYNRGDYEESRRLLEKAVQLKPSEGVARKNLAMTLAAVNEHDEALKHAEKALKSSPGNLNTHYAYGSILAQRGQVEEAVRHFERTIRKHRQCGGAYDHLARLKKFSQEDKSFIEKAEKELQRGMPAKDRLCLHFALGKMYDDCHKWDRAFEHYRQGNLLKKRNYDLKPERKNFARLKKLFTAESLREYQAMGNPSQLPVFIVGMPRSGTTLMERMIASCDNAAGAGELIEIPRIAKELGVTDESSNFIATLRANLTAGNISKYADEYLRILRQAGPDADRIVDKLPGNFYYLWLISILFPNASIVFAMRHPLDVSLSCYFQNFASLNWTYDLPLIADVYAFHREVMEYWMSILPEGKVAAIQYERLVEEPEILGKQMLEHCGLEWRGDGLATYKKERVVKTASLWQVRQPVYQSSKMRWKNYAAHIGDLANDLSGFLEEDRDDLARHDIAIAAPSGIKRLKRMFS